ncbi:hypothetical protein B9Z55_014411 [Caenorhabditis nigoni]|uniref:Uncharacterized protein n=1 Tax=Caenorhabditis nigoni TaxID=1611254 RepID=A0A2G5U5U8_9PELO|nr:hypothetical protein B9Z55_014411 [Caenorhabditis nigoni]
MQIFEDYFQSTWKEWQDGWQDFGAVGRMDRSSIQLAGEVEQKKELFGLRDVPASRTARKDYKAVSTFTGLQSRGEMVYRNSKKDFKRQRTRCQRWRQWSSGWSSGLTVETVMRWRLRTKSPSGRSSELDFIFVFFFLLFLRVFFFGGGFSGYLSDSVSLLFSAFVVVLPVMS